MKQFFKETVGILAIMALLFTVGCTKDDVTGSETTDPEAFVISATLDAESLTKTAADISISSEVGATLYYRLYEEGTEDADLPEVAELEAQSDIEVVAFTDLTANTTYTFDVYGKNLEMTLSERVSVTFTTNGHFAVTNIVTTAMSVSFDIEVDQEAFEDEETLAVAYVIGGNYWWGDYSDSSFISEFGVELWNDPLTIYYITSEEAGTVIPVSVDVAINIYGYSIKVAEVVYDQDSYDNFASGYAAIENTVRSYSAPTGLTFGEAAISLPLTELTESISATSIAYTIDNSSEYETYYSGYEKSSVIAEYSSIQDYITGSYWLDENSSQSFWERTGNGPNATTSLATSVEKSHTSLSPETAYTVFVFPVSAENLIGEITSLEISTEAANINTDSSISMKVGSVSTFGASIDVELTDCDQVFYVAYKSTVDVNEEDVFITLYVNSQSNASNKWTGEGTQALSDLDSETSYVLYAIGYNSTTGAVSTISSVEFTTAAVSFDSTASITAVATVVEDDSKKAVTIELTFSDDCVGYFSGSTYGEYVRDYIGADSDATFTANDTFNYLWSAGWIGSVKTATTITQSYWTGSSDTDLTDRFMMIIPVDAAGNYGQPLFYTSYDELPF